MAGLSFSFVGYVANGADSCGRKAVAEEKSRDRKAAAFQETGPPAWCGGVSGVRESRQIPVSAQPTDGSGERTSGMNWKTPERGTRALHHQRTGAISSRSPTCVPER